MPIALPRCAGSQESASTALAATIIADTAAPCSARSAMSIAMFLENTQATDTAVNRPDEISSVRRRP